jgi:hypothetical protein
LQVAGPRWIRCLAPAPFVHTRSLERGPKTSQNRLQEAYRCGSEEEAGARGAGAALLARGSHRAGGSCWLTRPGEQDFLMPVPAFHLTLEGGVAVYPRGSAAAPCLTRVPTGASATKPLAATHFPRVAVSSPTGRETRRRSTVGTGRPARQRGTNMHIRKEAACPRRSWHAARISEKKSTRRPCFAR